MGVELMKNKINTIELPAIAFKHIYTEVAGSLVGGAIVGHCLQARRSALKINPRFEPSVGFDYQYINECYGIVEEEFDSSISLLIEKEIVKQATFDDGAEFYYSQDQKLIDRLNKLDLDIFELTRVLSCDRALIDIAGSFIGGFILSDLIEARDSLYFWIAHEDFPRWIDMDLSSFLECDRGFKK